MAEKIPCSINVRTVSRVKVQLLADSPELAAKGHDYLTRTIPELRLSRVGPSHDGYLESRGELDVDVRRWLKPPSNSVTLRLTAQDSFELEAASCLLTHRTRQEWSPSGHPVRDGRIEAYTTITLEGPLIEDPLGDVDVTVCGQPVSDTSSEDI